jgi:hypothetical protein
VCVLEPVQLLQELETHGERRVDGRAARVERR